MSAQRAAIDARNATPSRRAADLSEVDRAILETTEKLTKTPGDMGQADVDGLKAAGLDDRAVHDLTQVVSYFNYINRVADGIHVDLEPEMDPYPGGART